MISSRKFLQGKCASILSRLRRSLRAWRCSSTRKRSSSTTKSWLSSSSNRVWYLVAPAGTQARPRPAQMTSKCKWAPANQTTTTIVTTRQLGPKQRPSAAIQALASMITKVVKTMRSPQPHPNRSKNFSFTAAKAAKTLAKIDLAVESISWPSVSNWVWQIRGHLAIIITILMKILMPILKKEGCTRYALITNRQR